jgi:hypothetical protein
MIRGVGSSVYSATFKGTDEKGNAVDRTVWFSFDALSFAYTESEAKMGIFDLIVAIGEGHGSLYFMHYFYGGARAHAKWNNMPEPTFTEVVRWLELIDEKRLLEIYEQSLKVFAPKKQAPTTGQQLEE